MFEIAIETREWNQNMTVAMKIILNEIFRESAAQRDNPSGTGKQMESR